MKKLTIIPTKVLGRCIDDKSTKDLLVELYALVNYTRTIVNGIEILPGQLRTSLSELMNRTGLTKKMVRKRLDWLYAHQYIHKETNHHCLIITIVDYCRILKDSNNLRAQKWAQPNSCKPNGCIEAINKKDTQVGTQASCDNNDIYIKDVEKETSTEIPVIERKMRLKEDVEKLICDSHLKGAMERIPDLKDSLNNFLDFYGRTLEDGSMLFEKIENFQVDFHLRKWLRKEKSLRGKIIF